MLPRLPRILATTALTAMLSGAVAAAKQPASVRDLHYGKVLFHFYQDDYFSAITHLMVAREQGQLPHHGDEAELLLGGLKLSYGLHVEAERIFRQLLDTHAALPVRDRAWYYLGKMAYQKGLPLAAEQALARMSADLSAEQHGERQLLIGLARLERGDGRGAAEALEAWKGNQRLQPYARYNLGVALVNGADAKVGMTVLDALGREAPDWALRDKTNLALGFALLQQEQPQQAIDVLRRVRAEGPFTDRARLGLGWAEIAQQRHDLALRAFAELADLPAHHGAAQEAWLALPYVHARLGDRRRAAELYRQAIERYEEERNRLELALAAIARGSLLPVLQGPPAAGLPRALPGRAYLVEVMATNVFQEALRSYRDLLVLQRNLDDWSAAMVSFEHMLAGREARYQDVLPRARQALAELDLEGLRQRQRQLQNALLQAGDESDALVLASEEERSHWQLLDRVDARLARLPAAETSAQREKARVMRGLLRWDMQQAYAARHWEAEKALRSLSEELAALEVQRLRLLQAQADSETGFRGFQARIDAEKRRIESLRPQVATALAEQAARLEQLVSAALARQQALLEQQISSARFGLARLHDEAARTEGEP